MTLEGLELVYRDNLDNRLRPYSKTQWGTLAHLMYHSKNPVKTTPRKNIYCTYICMNQVSKLGR